jgi:hypothetical protein
MKSVGGEIIKINWQKKQTRLEIWERKEVAKNVLRIRCFTSDAHTPLVKFFWWSRWL